MWCENEGVCVCVVWWRDEERGEEGFSVEGGGVGGGSEVWHRERGEAWRGEMRYGEEGEVRERGK